MRLTAAGRLLAAHGERVAAQLRQAERDLAELTGQASGPVRIAAFQSVMAPLIGPALRGLAAASPAIQPVIVACDDIKVKVNYLPLSESRTSE